MNQIWKKSFLAIFCAALWIASAAQSGSSKIAPELWAGSEKQGTVECIIRFRSMPDLQDLALIHGKENKGRIVFQRLKTTAENSQRHVRQLLARSGRPFHPFLVTNAIYTLADRELLRQLAALPEVDYIQANPWTKVLDRRPGTAVATAGRSPVEWGLEQIKVPEVWAQGIHGEGIIIGGQDTGVEWTHPTLKEKYRAWQGNEAGIDHNYHWFDAITAISPLHRDSIPGPQNNPCGLSVDFPCDDNDHGTYTMGISVGDDGLGNQIGVAPGARWIACRNMERGYGSPATYLAGFEWFLAPTDLAGNNPQPHLAPHVINNSWGCPTMEGCTIDNWGILENAIENLRAAGVVVIVSAGNEGPACGTVNDPSAIFAGAFSVGATNSTDTLAGFSSRGPVTVDGSNRIKPDVVAPGVRIRSARRNARFLTSSGTSAAGPFVVGVVALMIQANPQLAGEVALIEQILRETTVPAYDKVICAGYSDQDVPNPMTGYGRIDALAAVERARQVSPVAEPATDLQIKVYPNPSTGVFYFSAAVDTADTYLEVYDATGRLVEQRRVKSSPETLDLSYRPAGLYWWKWVRGEKTVSGKIIRAGLK